MPVKQGGPSPARQALMVGLGALLGLLAVIFLVTQFDQLGGDDNAEVQLGDPVFTVGQAGEIAPVIADQGPLLLPDAAQGDRDIYIQHLGDSDTRGWSAFAVRAPDAERECFVQWLAEDRTFVDACDGTAFPEDGEGLTQYAVSVNPEGALTVNLNPLGS
ncbi:MAG: hypothetical protein ACRBK7_28120 [Acidimicrobiales bacterium]